MTEAAAEDLLYKPDESELVGSERRRESEREPGKGGKNGCLSRLCGVPDMRQCRQHLLQLLGMVSFLC